MFYSTTNMWNFLGSDCILSGGNYNVLGLWFIVASTVAQILLSILSRKWKFLQYIDLPSYSTWRSPKRNATCYGCLHEFLAIRRNCILCSCVCVFQQLNTCRPISVICSDIRRNGLDQFYTFCFKKGYINCPKWWGSKLDDHCPLAKCASAPRIRAPKCP